MNEILENIREYFNSDVTKDINFRIKQLKNLKETFKKFEPLIYRALKDDLNKPDMEIYSMEYNSVLEELDFAIHNLRKWAKPEKVYVPSIMKPNNGYILKEPYGIVLIIGAFNYPFQLTFVPLIGAIAAGNCTIVKPSKSAGESAKIIEAIIKETFEENYIKCEFSNEITQLKYDYIFFTGNPKTGAMIAEKAGKNLTPITLELGGKSPVIVEKSANLEEAARKIAWGKFVNAGQTCIAPDYILIDETICEKFIEELKKAIKEFYGPIPQMSESFGRIISESAFSRIKNLIDYEKLIIGGNTDECGLYIEPTVVWYHSYDEKIMQEEIFGPVLPVMKYNNFEEIIQTLKTKEKPLAFYIFTQDKKLAEKTINILSFGGGAVNETLIQAGNIFMPFGGVGMSGMGQYHGKYTFDTFSHKKSVLGNIHKKAYYRNLPPYEIKIPIRYKK